MSVRCRALPKSPSDPEDLVKQSHVKHYRETPRKVLAMNPIAKVATAAASPTTPISRTFLLTLTPESMAITALATLSKVRGH